MPGVVLELTEVEGEKTLSDSKERLVEDPCADTDLR